ncbi:MAG: hypothetical protein AAGJ35_13035, partial [Myxococcota bacterium]
MKDLKNTTQDSVTSQQMIKDIVGNAEVIVFDDDEVVTNEHTVTFDTVEAVAAQMAEPRLDLVSDGEAFAIITDRLPLEDANYIVDNGETLAGMYLIEPASVDLVPDFFLTEVGLKGRLFTLQHDCRYKLAKLCINDAVLRGTPCDEFEELMRLEVPISCGRTKDTKWSAQEKTWADWIIGDQKTWGFSVHVATPKKGLLGHVFAALNGSRTKKATTALSAIGLDLDGGHLTYDQVIEVLEEKGVACFVYTTHSHLTEKVELGFDTVAKHADCDADPSEDDVRKYMLEVKKYAPH